MFEPTRSRVAIGLIVLTSGLMCSADLASSADDNQADVRTLLDEGQFALAESSARALVAGLSPEGTAFSIDQLRAFDLLVEALVKNDKASDDYTLQLAKRAVTLKETPAAGDQLELAVSLHNLGATYVERGEFRQAVPLFERALSIRSKRFGPAHELVASTLEAMAYPEMMLERFDTARQRLDQVLVVRQGAVDHRPIALAGALELDARLKQFSGDYQAAMSVVDRALAIRNRPSSGYSDATLALHIRGDLLFLSGDVSGAEVAWTEALTAARRLHGADHSATSPLLRKLALAADALGNRAESRTLLARAMDTGRRFAPCHPEVVWLLNDSALSKRRDGDYGDAQKLYQTELQTIRNCKGSADSLATALHNQAQLVAEMGDLQEAERIQRQAVRVWSESLNGDHPYVARALDALAEVVAARGDTARALALYQRVLRIRRASGAETPDVAWTLTNLAKTVADNGDVVTALGYVDQAIAIFQTSGASDEPDHFARVLELRGTLLAQRGDLTRARESLSSALGERERIFGTTHPLAAETRAALARVDFARGAFGNAFAAALSAEQGGRDHLRFTTRYLPERQAMSYAEKRPRGLDLALSISSSGAFSDPARAFDAVIQSRGIVLDEIAARSRALNEASDGVSALHAQMIASRQRLANLVIRSLREPVSRAVLDDARRQKEDAERAVAASSADASLELTRASTRLEDIQRKLPAGGSLVSFVRYERTPIRSSGRSGLPPAIESYAAFVMPSGSPTVTFVPLGPAVSIDDAVRTWRNEASRRTLDASSSAQAERQYRLAANRLRTMVWDPLGPEVADHQRIFIVPDGLLTVVNFASLPDRAGRYMIENGGVIHYLSTERDLITAEEHPVASGTLLAVGGPAFDAASPNGRTKPLRSPAGCESLGRLRFDLLPGSLGEVTEISKLWPEASVSGVTVLSGRAASETAVKNALSGRRVIHLATHGFFLGDDCLPAAGGTRAVGGLTTGTGRTSTRRRDADNPLLLSGLAFAGANRRVVMRADEDDGILTAEEVASLNLAGVEWAVLSACDTGLGEIKAGEGVFGLRRAFQIAGARTVIMSLWSVEDDSTREWMRALYRGRLQQRLDTAAAVREAGLTILRARRAKGQSTHPFYWAAFVAAGDWR